MKKQKNTHKIVRFFKFIYIKFFRIHDSPQKIALGIWLGVFMGVVPGTGPLAALFFAWILRVNRASALLGSLLANTWLSILTLLLSIKLGSAILKIKWQDVYSNWIVFLKNFHWLNLCKPSVLKIILPVILGYCVVAFCLGFVFYLVTLIALTRIRRRND